MTESHAVWPDGAREAVDAAHDRWIRRSGFDPTSVADDILTALEPFVQQRIEAALSEIDEMVPPAIGIYQTIPDRVRLVIAQRDEAESIVADLRAEVARLREDGGEASDRERRLNVMLSRTRAELSAICLAVIQEMTAAIGRGEPYTYQSASLNGGVIHSTRGDLNDLKRSLELAIDAARSARGGEG